MRYFFRNASLYISNIFVFEASKNKGTLFEILSNSEEIIILKTFLLYYETYFFTLLIHNFTTRELILNCFCSTMMNGIEKGYLWDARDIKKNQTDS